MRDEFDIPADAAQLNGSTALAKVREAERLAYHQPDMLHKLAALVRAARAAEALADALGEQQKLASAIAKGLFGEIIPDMMDDAGIDSLALTDKDAIKLKDDVKAAISKDNRERALEALIELGHGDVIKWGLHIPVDRGTSVADVREIRKQLQELGYPSGDDSGVHPQTLSALARELLAEGFDLDQPTPNMRERGDNRTVAELLSLYVQRKAAIVAAQGKKTRKS